MDVIYVQTQQCTTVNDINAFTDRFNSISYRIKDVKVVPVVKEFVRETFYMVTVLYTTTGY